MSGGKKRSGFQITSVTSDYSETPPSPAQLSQSTTSAQGSSSQPTTPLLLRKYNSQDAPGQGAGSSHSSRFRVVRLAQGRGEPYRRGRWTCTDFLEREEGVGLRRVMDTMRHAHSLESLETVGLIGPGGAGGGAGGGLLAHVHALRAGHHVHSQGTTHLLAQRMAMEGEEFAGLKPLLHNSGPPSPTHQEPINVRYFDCTPPPPSPRPRNIPPPLKLDVDSTGRSLLRVSHSQPSSPPGGGDGFFQPSLTPIQTPSAFNLDRSMFDLPGDDSGSSSSMVAIDNKIEQAMDLVKTHLRLAVREEVEILREQIKELQDRNAQLERENYILRALRDRE
ncbi:TSC22 domain family protein 4 [Aplochiton taeniatus]